MRLNIPNFTEREQTDRTTNLLPFTRARQMGENLPANFKELL